MLPSLEAMWSLNELFVASESGGSARTLAQGRGLEVCRQGGQQLSLVSLVRTLHFTMSPVCGREA